MTSLSNTGQSNLKFQKKFRMKLRTDQQWQNYGRTVLGFESNFALEDAVGSHACSLEASMRVTKDIPLGCPLPLTFVTVHHVATLKALFCCRLPAAVARHELLFAAPATREALESCRTNSGTVPPFLRHR